MSELSIGQLASRAGVSASAIRFYEREKLLPAARRVGGKRRFDDSDLARLGLIKLGQAAGFSLDEIRALIRGAEGKARHAQTMQRLAEAKLPEVQEQLKTLRAMERLLKAAVSCGCPDLQVCLQQAERGGLVLRADQ